MKFNFKVWILTIEIDLFDVDIADKDVGIGIVISWKG